MRPCVLFALSIPSLVSAMLVSDLAAAATPKDEAHAAYERGLAAHARGDEALASDEFAHADNWLPSDAALEAAVESAERASDAVRVVRLVLRAEAPGRSLDAAASRTVQEARRTYLPRVALLEVQCTNVANCTLAVDDAPAIDAHAPVPVLPGTYRLHVRRDEANEEATADVSAGQVVTFAHAWTAAPTSAPAASTPVAPALLEPLATAAKPAWARPVTWLGIGVTAALAGVAIGSGIDTANKRSDFTMRQCDAGSGAIDPSCAQLSQDGKSAQVRTDLLIAGAAVAGAATLTFVLIERPFAQMNASVGPREARLTLRFP